MRTKIIMILAVWAIMPLLTLGQSRHVVFNGTIEFEKTVNMYAVLKRMVGNEHGGQLSAVYESYVTEKPQFKKFKSLLFFSEKGLLFQPQEDSEDMMIYRNPMITQNNIIYTNLKLGEVAIFKSISGKRFQIRDSVLHINWKITDERRDILGYPCRRANAIILDSLYVVAFYTDKIPVSGGPESFAGLPGMILGVVLPHENINWFATKITEQPTDVERLKPKFLGQPINRIQFSDELKTILSGTNNINSELVKGARF